jgi:hypothetical protein
MNDPERPPILGYYRAKRIKRRRGWDFWSMAVMWGIVGMVVATCAMMIFTRLLYQFGLR